MSTRLEGIDLWNPDNYADGPPHHMFTRLRREAPVYRHDEPDGPGFWVISRFADIQALSRDWATFSSARGGTEITDYPEEELQLLRMLLLYMDPPQHTRYRLLVTKAFTPRTVTALTTRIERLAERIVDDVVERGEADFVGDIADRMPLEVIAEMIGIPPEDREQVAEWSHRIIGWMDPELAAQRSDATAASVEMLQYAAELAEYKRHHPGDDITTELVHAEVEHDGVPVRLADHEIGLFFLLLAIAGNETTRNLVSQGMLAFIEHPDQWALLRSQPELMPQAIDEMLRWATPTMHFRRTATRDLELHGEHIREGDKVTLWYISGNRDEDKFTDPFRFDIARSPTEHLAFGGGGPHFCFGSHLARIEITALFQQIAARIPDVRRAGPVRRLRSNFANAIKEMPVRFSPGPVAAGLARTGESTWHE
jgi:cholest-4-en-3-one 26-monooxygenase